MRARCFRWPARVEEEASPSGTQRIRFFQGGGIRDQVADVTAKCIEPFYSCSDPSAYDAKASNARVQKVIPDAWEWHFRLDRPALWH